MTKSVELETGSSQTGLRAPTYSAFGRQTIDSEDRRYRNHTLEMGKSLAAQASAEIEMKLDLDFELVFAP